MMGAILDAVLRTRRAQSEARPPARSDVALLYASEIDRLYRLREGTAHALAAAGKVRCVKRRRGGRARWCYLIAPADAAAIWGPK